jgi:hypothetical protein
MYKVLVMLFALLAGTGITQAQDQYPDQAQEQERIAGAFNWEGDWIVDYDGVPMYLNIVEVGAILQGSIKANPDPQYDNAATITEARAGSDNHGSQLTGVWTAIGLDNYNGQTTGQITLDRITPTSFEGSISWADGLKLSFNGTR